MPEYNDIIRRMVERLYDDEQLRSNLADDEAKIVFSWAESWLATQVGAADDEIHAEQVARSEFTRVRQTVATMNMLAAKSGFTVSEGITALEPTLKTMQAMPRAGVFKLLTRLVETMWRMQQEPAEYKSVQH